MSKNYLSNIHNCILRMQCTIISYNTSCLSMSKLLKHAMMSHVNLANPDMAAVRIWKCLSCLLSLLCWLLLNVKNTNNAGILTCEENRKDDASPLCITSTILCFILQNRNAVLKVSYKTLNKTSTEIKTEMSSTVSQYPVLYTFTHSWPAFFLLLALQK